MPLLGGGGGGGEGGDVDLSPLTARVTDVEDGLETAQEALTTVQGAVTDVQTAVGTVQTDVADAQTAIVEVQELVAGVPTSGIRVWEAGELAWTHYFDEAFGSGPSALFEVTGGWGPGVAHIVAAASAPADHPEFANFVKFDATDGGAPTMFFYLDRVAELAGKSPVLLKCWVEVVTGGDFRVSQNGVTKATVTSVTEPSGWERVTAALNGELDGDDYVTFQGDRYTESWLGGLEIYVESDNPFMLNDLAIYDNQVYKSMTDNNAATPGDDASWEVVLVQTSITDLEARVAALEGA